LLLLLAVRVADGGVQQQLVLRVVWGLCCCVVLGGLCLPLCWIGVMLLLLLLPTRF
jgi:hypothetical protein